MLIAQYLFKTYDIIFSNTENKIILTIDDIPYDDKNFEIILNILNKYNCKATFFVISSLVTNKNKNLLLNAIKSGHHLANHGIHNVMHARYNYSELEYEIETCQKKINELYIEANIKKPKIKYFRPGCGLVTNDMNKYCIDNNYKIVLGTNYCSDPHISNLWLNKFYIKQHLKDNDIIILHDRKWTPKLLEYLFNKKINNGLGITTYSMESFYL